MISSSLWGVALQCASVVLEVSTTILVVWHLVGVIGCLVVHPRVALVVSLVVPLLLCRLLRVASIHPIWIVPCSLVAGSPKVPLVVTEVAF